MQVRSTARRASSRVVLLLTALALVAPLAGAPAAAAGKEVIVRDNEFGPAKLSAALGSTVTWKSASSSATAHNVRQERKIFRSGEPTTEIIDYARRFSAGTFPYYCEVHGFPGGGMAGVVKVPVKITSVSATAFMVAWATGKTNTGTRFDVQFKVGSGAWKSWKQSASGAGATFGGNNKPVAVKPGVRYSFRARSLRNGKASGWSPARAFTP